MPPDVPLGVARKRIIMADSAPAQLPIPGSLMRGKRGLIMGVANDRSLAWGIAAACAAQGAELAFGALAERWDRLDFLVHAIGYIDKAYLRGRYLDTPRAAFLQAMDISCYSFTAVCQRAVPMMQPGGSLLTLSYLGAERWVPHYNAMGVAKAALEASVRYLAADLGSAGIRCNAISAGPIKTLAASAIGDFRYILRWNQLNSPMQRNVTIDEVGGAGVYLLSDLASGVTGEVHHVDCGYHVVGMKHPDAPDIAIEQS
jgi:enoyl-[acyl-carrier protein] reductase I